MRIVALLDLDKYYVQDPSFRPETAQKLNVFLGFVKEFVLRKCPMLDDESDRSRSERDKLLRDAETCAFTALVDQFNRWIPTEGDARNLWLRAVAELPRNRRQPCWSFFVARHSWKEFVRKFEFPRSRREARDHSGLHLTAFGFLLARMSREQLLKIVVDGLGEMPELKEVVEWSALSSASSPLFS